jgi:hypothetical protein
MLSASTIRPPGVAAADLVVRGVLTHRTRLTERDPLCDPTESARSNTRYPDDTRANVVSG